MLGGFLLTTAGLDRACGQVPEVPKDRNTFMQLKLRNAQLILEGVSVKDFKLIESSAETLVLLSQKAQFQMGNIPGYERYGDEFRRTAESLIRLSKDKNLDGAALAYVQLTTNCVNCHRHLREARGNASQ
jgi:hypothetical protein